MVPFISMLHAQIARGVSQQKASVICLQHSAPAHLAWAHVYYLLIKSKSKALVHRVPCFHLCLLLPVTFQPDPQLL
jgi:hypothetical protein